MKRWPWLVVGGFVISVSVVVQAQENQPDPTLSQEVGIMEDLQTAYEHGVRIDRKLVAFIVSSRTNTSVEANEIEVNLRALQAILEAGVLKEFLETGYVDEPRIQAVLAAKGITPSEAERVSRLSTLSPEVDVCSAALEPASPSSDSVAAASACCGTKQTKCKQEACTCVHGNDWDGRQYKRRCYLHVWRSIYVYCTPWHRDDLCCDYKPKSSRQPATLDE